ncbi:SH3 domain-containing protein [Sphingomicrobium arenosum]|uniref:SH3 domain-containing protein n=1 Tax=Sphingomicrobium arenosum TaxID=2233861 RepID=UPI00223F56FB|nr:SH3 domain-containing protein [Sphingomicrobium arenosum]
MAAPNGNAARSARPSSKPPIREFDLTGTSADLPDPTRHAYRKDLADVALAGRVIASHYAAPVARELRRDAPLRSEPDCDAELVIQLAAGDAFDLLDNRGGWVWGYAGPDRRVGYVKEEALV